MLVKLVDTEQLQIEDGFTVDSSGFLRCTGALCKVGVQQYPELPGKPSVLRHPDDVFSEDALASMRLLPVTVDHPGVFVDSKNWRSLSVGSTGENVRVDGRFVKVPIVVTDAAAIESVKSGKRELSVGYEVNLEEEIGTYDGVEYTHRQRNIKGNHVAIVDRGKAGPDARLFVDSKQGDNRMKTVIFDGIPYEVPDEVAMNVGKLKATLEKTESQALADIETSESKLSKLQAVADEASAAKEKAEARIKELEDSKGDTSALADAVRSRIELVAKLAKVSPDVDIMSMLDKSEKEINDAIIHAVHPKIDLADKSDDYISARVDAILDSIGDEGMSVAFADSISKIVKGEGDKKINLSDVDTARAEYLKNLSGKKGD